MSSMLCPGQVAQLVRMSSCYDRVAGLIPGQGTGKSQQCVGCWREV